MWLLGLGGDEEVQATQPKAALAPRPEKPTPMLVEKPTPMPVTLHVYDLKSASNINSVMRAIGTGAYHAGVELYGREWSYGGKADGLNQSGVYHIAPGAASYYEDHQYREAIPMGYINMPEADVARIINGLSKSWRGSEYDILRHNCCHFCDQLCRHLGLGPIPSWITSAAGVGATLHTGAIVAGAGASMLIEGAWGVAAGAMQVAGEVLGTADTTSPHATPNGAPTQGRRLPVRPGLRPVSDLSRGMDDGAGSHNLGFGDGSLSGGSAGSHVNELPRLNVGERVEVFSNNAKQWCPGHVTALGNGDVTVSFQVPGRTHLDMKVLPLESPQLRYNGVAGGQPPTRASASTAFADAAWKTGDPVEVYSRTFRTWLPGHVEQVESPGVLLVAFQHPRAPAGESHRKRLPVGHSDVRRRPVLWWTAE